MLQNVWSEIKIFGAVLNDNPMLQAYAILIVMVPAMLCAGYRGWI